MRRPGVVVAVAVVVSAITLPASASTHTVDVEPAARFAVRAGVVNGGNISNVFNGASCLDGPFGSEAFLEYALGFGPVATATVDLEVIDIGFSPGSPEQTWDVSVYAADGQASADDCGAGSLLTSLSMPAGERTAFALEVAAHVEQLQHDGQTHLGVRFSNTNDGQLSVVGPGPFGAPLLRVVPAPDTDGDGVIDRDDRCPDTELPEPMPPRWKRNRYLANGSGVFVDPVGREAGTTLADTAGCSGTQIIEAADLHRHHTRFGLTRRAIERWVDHLDDPP